MEVTNKTKKTFLDLVKNNTGVSIKSFFLLEVSILGGIILLVVPFVLVWDVVVNGSIKSSVADIASLIGAISGLFVAAGLPKIIGELKERRNNNELNKDV